jgi:hypothetical protein
LSAAQPEVPQQDQLAASFAGGELNPIALSRDLRDRLLAADRSPDLGVGKMGDQAGRSHNHRYEKDHS